MQASIMGEAVVFAEFHMVRVAGRNRSGTKNETRQCIHSTSRKKSKSKPMRIEKNYLTTK